MILSTITVRYMCRPLKEPKWRREWKGTGRSRRQLWTKYFSIDWVNGTLPSMKTSKFAADISIWLWFRTLVLTNLDSRIEFSMTIYIFWSLMDTKLQFVSRLRQEKEWNRDNFKRNRLKKMPLLKKAKIKRILQKQLKMKERRRNKLGKRKLR